MPQTIRPRVQRRDLHDCGGQAAQLLSACNPKAKQHPTDTKFVELGLQGIRKLKTAQNGDILFASRLKCRHPDNRRGGNLEVGGYPRLGTVSHSEKSC